MNNGIFNPEMLATARKYRGWAQKKASELCGISQAKYNKIENGVSEADDNIIAKFSSVFDFPEKFFLKNSRAIGMPMSFHGMYRKQKSVNMKEQARVSADLTIRLICIAQLLQAVDIDATLPLPQYDIEDDDVDAVAIAQMVRRSWLLPNGPIRNLTEIIEKAGIIVFPCFFPAPRVDGVTVNISGFPPIIFLNESATADRMRFSLAHELGHVVMHRQMSATMEDEANAFASELLMPAADMQLEFSGRVDLKSLAILKRVWKVSMQALLYRASSLGKLSKNQSDYLWRQINTHGYRKNEPISTQFEKDPPTLLKNILELHMNELGCTHEDLASIFNLNVEMVKRLFTTSIIKNRKLKLVV